MRGERTVGEEAAVGEGRVTAWRKRELGAWPKRGK